MRIQDLSIEERLQLIGDIWDTIVAEQEVVSLNPEQRDELDRRLAAYRVDSNRGKPAVDRIEQLRRGL